MSTRLLLTLTGVLALALTTFTGCEMFNGDDDDDSGRSVTRSEEFLTDAARGHMAEQQMAQLALQNSQSSQVRQLSQQILDDHSQAQREVTRLASSVNLSLPNQPNQNQRSMIQELQGLRGEQFDRLYLASMEDSHRKAINLYRSQGTDVSNTDVRNYAQTTLPVLERHLQMVQQIQRSMGDRSNTLNTQNQQRLEVRPMGTGNTGSTGTGGGASGNAADDTGTRSGVGQGASGGTAR